MVRRGKSAKTAKTTPSDLLSQHTLHPALVSAIPTAGRDGDELASPASVSTADHGSRHVVHDTDMKTAGRPYRSHKYPACTRCHKRRSRCTIEEPGQACLLCRMHGVPCSSASLKSHEKTLPKLEFVRRSLLSGKDFTSEPSHILGPIIARDTQVLESLLPAAATGGEQIDFANYTSGGSKAGQPIYHTAVPPRRPSLNDPAGCSCVGSLPNELLDRVEPFLHQLTALFFEDIHPCLPIVDEHCIVTRVADRSLLPLTFLCNLHANTMFYWNKSEALRAYEKPDQDFAWQVAIKTSMADLSKSDLTTIVSTLLNITGRPSTCFVSNTVNVARAVALAHSIGLNHDCSGWKMLDVEKKVRHQTWWATLLQDRWYNFAYGSPPLITKGHYDAPIPTVHALTSGRSTSIKHRRAAECYIALCHLTEIIGDVLPLIYHIRSGHESKASMQVSRSEINLNQWVVNLPAWLDLTGFEMRLPVPGLANLQLSYLAVRMLLRRIAWHEISQREADPEPAWLSDCFVAASEIVQFVTSLTPTDFSGFWLPYNSHHFASAVTLILRCALQTTQEEMRHCCLQRARELVDFLRRAKEHHNWDLVDACLPQSESMLTRIETALSRNSPPGSTGISPGPQYPGNDMFLSPAPDDAAPWQSSIEELFPELFSDFQDTALFEGPTFRASSSGSVSQ